MLSARETIHIFDTVHPGGLTGEYTRISQNILVWHAEFTAVWLKFYPRLDAWPSGVPNQGSYSSHIHISFAASIPSMHGRSKKC